MRVPASSALPRHDVAAAPASPRVQSAPYVLTPEEARLVRWEGPHSGVGRLDMPVLGQGQVSFDVIRTADGHCLIGAVEQAGRRFRAFDAEGGFAAHFYAERHHDTVSWHRGGLLGGVSTDAFLVDRVRFYEFLKDVGQRSELFQTLRPWLRGDEGARFPQAQGLSDELMGWAVDEIAKTWNPFDQADLRLVIDQRIAREPGGSSGPSDRARALAFCRDWFLSSPEKYDRLSDAVVRQRSSELWWVAKREAEKGALEALGKLRDVRRDALDSIGRSTTTIQEETDALLRSLPGVDPEGGTYFAEQLGRRYPPELVLLNGGDFVMTPGFSLRNTVLARIDSLIADVFQGRVQGSFVEAMAVLGTLKMHCANPAWSIGPVVRLWRAHLGLAQARHALNQVHGDELLARRALFDLRQHHCLEGRARAARVLGTALVALTHPAPHPIGPDVLREAFDLLLNEWGSDAADFSRSDYQPAVSASSGLPQMLDWIVLSADMQPRVEHALRYVVDRMLAPESVLGVRAIRAALYLYRLNVTEGRQNDADWQHLVNLSASDVAGAGEPTLSRHGASVLIEELFSRWPHFSAIRDDLLSDEREYFNHYMAQDWLGDAPRVRVEMQELEKLIDADLETNDATALIDNLVQGVGLISAVIDSAGLSWQEARTMSQGLHLMFGAHNPLYEVGQAFYVWGHDRVQPAAEESKNLAREVCIWFWSTLQPAAEDL